MERIHPRATESLIHQPETGMGWQLVDVRLSTGEAALVRVFNAELLVSQPLAGHVREAAARDRRAIEAVVEWKAGTQLHVLTRSEAMARGFLEKSVSMRGGPANEAAPEWSDANEEFRRFSAFANDRRVNADGSLVPGTYATPAGDANAHVRTGMDAVRRYALPNPDPAIHRYWLMSAERLRVQRGTAQPAFGQPGGGAEVIFLDGAPARTKHHQDTIPPGE